MSGVRLDNAKLFVAMKREPGHHESSVMRSRRTVFVDNIPLSFTKNKVEDFFKSKVGIVEYVDLPKNEEGS